jgi:hypothetical protein
MTPTRNNPYADLHPHLAKLWNLGFDHGSRGNDPVRVDLNTNSQTSKVYREGYDAATGKTEAKPTTFKEILEMDETKSLLRSLVGISCSAYARRLIRLTLIEAGVDPVLAKRCSKTVAWAAYLVAANVAVGWRVGKHAAKEWSNDA